jgi:hypothetical protein
MVCAVASPLQAQTLLAPPKPADSGTIDVAAFASGNIRGMVTGNDSLTSGANGALGVQLTTPRYTVSALINVAAAGSMLTSGFAKSLLSPASGSSLRSALLELRLPAGKTFSGTWGWHIYASASASTWRSPTDDTRQAAASVTGLGVLLYRQVAATKDDNSVSVGIEGGLSIRNLSGDIISDEALRRELLGTSTRTFWGFEGGMTVGVNKATAAIQLYYYFPNNAPGLGRVQITTGLSLSADLFSFKSSPPSR